MYILGSSLINLPILSLQSGQPIAFVSSPIIKPETLEIVAIFLQSGTWRKNTAVVLARDIREITREGLIIDSLDDIEDASEIVRLQAVITQKFNPMGLLVVDQSGNNLGKVEDYTVDAVSYKIQKLYLKQSLLKNMLLNNVIVDRSQIIDIQPTKIVVRDATVKESHGSLSARPIPQE
ncbi:MAG: hypothetical protein ACHQUB_01610 [Candidatus Saccharimonadia bacterium]